MIDANKRDRLRLDKDAFDECHAEVEIKDEPQSDDEGATPGLVDVAAEGDLQPQPDILSDIMAMPELAAQIFKTMTRDLIKNQMWKEADALEARYLEYKHCTPEQIMTCQFCQKKIEKEFAFCTWCMESLGAYTWSGNVRGDSSSLDQQTHSLRSKTKKKPIESQSDEKSHESFYEFFINSIHPRSDWGWQAEELKKKYKRMTKVSDWRDLSKLASYTSLAHRWDNDETYRKRQESQRLWDRDSAVMYDDLCKDATAQSKRNAEDPILGFSWVYRQTEQFARRFRPRQLVQVRKGGSLTISHMHQASSATLGGP